MAPPLDGVPPQTLAGPISGYLYRLTGPTWAHVHAEPDWSQLTVRATDRGGDFVFRPSILLQPVKQGKQVVLRCELTVGQKERPTRSGTETVNETRDLVFVLGAAADLDRAVPERPSATVDIDDRSGKLWCRLAAGEGALALIDSAGAPRLVVTATSERQRRLPIDAQLVLEGRPVFVVRVIDGDGQPTAAQVTLQP